MTFQVTRCVRPIQPQCQYVLARFNKIVKEINRISLLCREGVATLQAACLDWLIRSQQLGPDIYSTNVALSRSPKIRTSPKMH